jgi:hypothetical protein
MTALIRIDGSWTADAHDGARPIRFCTRCGQPAEEPPSRPPQDLDGRVCGRCGMGLMLVCAREALPGAGAAFLIVTFDLRVSAVSEPGEEIFGPEQSLLEVPLLDLLMSPVGDDRLAQHVGRAAERLCEPLVLPVRLRSWEAGRHGTMAARISTCAPPRAALVTVEPTKFGRHD